MARTMTTTTYFVGLLLLLCCGPSWQQASSQNVTEDVQSMLPIQGTPADNGTVTTFYVIADAPYSDIEERALEQQLKALPPDAEFIVHLGDIKDGDAPCNQLNYNKSSTIFQNSPVPMFMTVGDNEWTDCEDQDQGWALWLRYYREYDLMHWNHTFAVQRQPDRVENFAFVHRNTLFIGVNLVGGEAEGKEERAERKARMKSQVTWTTEVVSQYTGGLSRFPRNWSIGALVVFGHGTPKELRRKYLRGVRKILKNKLKNQLPAVYVNGDKHEWDCEAERFYGALNWKRVQLTGGTTEPIIKFQIDTSQENLKDVIQFDRRMGAGFTSAC